MDKPEQRLKNTWARQFPEIEEEWPYWWIEGDGYWLAIIDGNNLDAAVEIIEDNWERFSSIKAAVAKRIDGDLMRKKRSDIEISNRKCSKEELENYINQSKAAGEE